MKTKILLCTIALCLCASVKAQEYLRMIEEGTHTVAEIVQNAETYFQDRDKGRGSGYKQFKRWEYMANRLMNEEGYVTPITENISELENYNAYLNNTSGQRASLNDNWEELGPVNWNATTSWNPGVGRITGISVDATNFDHMIVGANTGGVWRSVDGGATWTPLGDYFSNMTVFSVTIDPNDSDTYYFGSSSGLIYKSTDTGGTWNQIADLGNSAVNKILVNPNDSDMIFASSSNSGVFRTTNGGTDWTQVVSSRGYDIEFKPGDTNTVYASSYGVFRSTDGGATFSAIGSWDDEAKMMGVSADNPDVLYVVDEDNGGFGDIYRSDDSGDTFTLLPHTGRNYFGYDTGGNNPGGQAPRDMDITVNPNDVDEVHIAGILTWRSLDGGQTFENTSDWIPGSAASANVGYCHADVDILEFYGGTLFVGTDGGIFKAATPAITSETMYEDLTTGIGIRQFYKIGISQTEDVIVTGGSQDNGTSFYSETTGEWRDWIGADGMEGFVDKNDTDKMFGMIQFGEMYRTFNGATGITNLPEPPGNGNWVTPFEQDPVEDGTVYVGYERVFKSTNFGANWDPISQDFGDSLDEMKVARTNNQIIYASRGGLIYRTTDGGATDWEQLALPGGLINNFAIHPEDPDTVALAVNGSNKVLITNDGGQTWSPLLLNLPNFQALSIVWDNNGENGLYLGMNYGIYYIDDTFTEWQPYFNNLPNVIINELEINFAEGKIYAGSYGRGLWVSSTQYGTILNTDENVLSEEKVVLLPNPANEEVTIQLTEAMETDIRVFDMAGKLLIYQADVEINGRHSIDISQLNTGIYFVRMNSDYGTVTKRIIKE
ncbi:MAG: T9SS type A sorting domain-containing protein [Flavobacteriaceae bacterium]|nr:T9SS type A sorting domain-containing protein [Flavobacteriaceae bacterium]